MKQIRLLLPGNNLCTGWCVGGDKKILLRITLVQFMQQWQCGIDLADGGAMQPQAVLRNGAESNTQPLFQITQLLVANRFPADVAEGQWNQQKIKQAV